MKVIIVGGGISGLSAALWLKKYIGTSDLHIQIYDSHPRNAPLPALGTATFEELSAHSAIIGGGIGLAPNGMRILRELDQHLYDEVCAAGFKAENFVFKAARGWRLMCSPTSDRRGQEGWPAGEEEVCLAVSRHGLWEALQRAAEGKVETAVKKVVKVKKADLEHKAKVIFDDGSEEEADLVIGADGVKSVVRSSLFEGTDVAVKAKYEGLIGVGGFTDNVVPAEVLKEKSMVFEFGPNGFFGYSAISPKTCMWWSTCQAEDVPAERKITPEEMRADLKKRHASWKDPYIHEIIEKSEVQQIWPTWTTPDLPSWGERGVVLVGDAAHALQPTSGQGSSQALEDSKCLAMLVSKFMTKVKEDPESLEPKDALNLAIKAFYDVRHPRLHKILVRTNKMSGLKKDLSYPAEMMTYFFLWLMGRFPSFGKLMLGDVPRELHYWEMEKLVDEAVEKSLKSSSK